MTHPDINLLIDNCIRDLAGDSIHDGVDGLYELAGLFKSAGYTSQEWGNVCQYIEEEAAAISDEVFINMKINAALKMARERKNGAIIKFVN